jgi:hypothetical protein
MARNPRAKIIALVVAIALVAVAAGTYALTRSVARQSALTTTARLRADHAAASGSRSGSRALSVLSVTPAAGTRHANGAEPVEVKFSAPLAASSPTPTLSPAVAGQWNITGDAMTFTPDAPFSPSRKVTLRVPAGAAGVRSAAGGTLAAPLVTHFSTAAYSRLRLSELLAQLGYLPLTWAPDLGGKVQSWQNGGQGAAVSQAAMAYSPPAGRFTWDPGYPAMLRSKWRPAAPNLIVRGAVMAFESQHGMQLGGVASPQVWQALFAAASRSQINPAGYTYAVASQLSPESLTIWHDGRVVMRSPANTGIPVSPTANGTFPVYLRYQFQIMRGTNPDGSTYADPVSYVAYFNGGDAVHYFPRGSYGFQQSLGCVELPYAAAQQAWPYLTYGSLVTVTG